MSISEETVVLHLPAPLYRQARRAAETQHRPVEEILLEALSTALPPLMGLPEELADDLAELAFLNDAALWNIARATLGAEHQDQMDDLLARKGQGQITQSEQLRLDELIQQYERYVLRRSQAAVLLQRRGYDVSDPSTLNRLP
jgi:hypothetical protein